MEETYNLEDALVVALNFNAFIRHAESVKMANLAQIVNVIAPIFTNPAGQVLQTIFFPFELYSSTCGKTALDVWWDGDTFTSSKYGVIRILDIVGTIDESRREMALYVVNRSAEKFMDAEIALTTGRFDGKIKVCTINGPVLNLKILSKLQMRSA